jgi:LytS/YehU family sensor histidine kinase
MYLAFVLGSNDAFDSTHIAYNVVVFILFGGISYLSLVKNYIHKMQENKSLQYLAILLAVSLTAASLHIYILNFIHFSGAHWSYKFYICLAYLFLLIFGSSLEFLVMSNKLKVKYLESEKYKSKQEVNLLKARIEPHFLFNALNNIYALARKNDARTQDYIMDVSTLLRYIVDQSHNEEVTIGQEVEFMRSFIELERTRFKESDACTVSISIGADSAEKIPPLLVFPFLENAFKHSENPSEGKREVHFSFNVVDDRVEVLIENTKGQVGERRMRERELSVEQARLRLHSLRQKAVLNITVSNSIYKVELSFPIHE